MSRNHDTVTVTGRPRPAAETNLKSESLRLSQVHTEASLSTVTDVPQSDQAPPAARVAGLNQCRAGPGLRLA
jgi:hypothetical protein